VLKKTLASIIVNETLYIIQNYFGKVGETNLVTTIVGFYDDDEVVGAKDVLYNVAESLKLEGAPRLVKRKAGENKRRLDCDDIIALWKAFVKLQMFQSLRLQQSKPAVFRLSPPRRLTLCH